MPHHTRTDWPSAYESPKRPSGRVTRSTVFAPVEIPPHIASPALSDWITTDERDLIERRATARHRAAFRSWMNECARLRRAPEPDATLDGLQRGTIRPRLLDEEPQRQEAGA